MGKLPSAAYIRRQYTDAIEAFGGLCLRPERTKEGQMSKEENISAERYPYLSPRGARIGLGIQNPAAVFDWDGLVIAQDGKLLYNGEQLTTVTPGEKQMAVVNTKLVVWPDKLVIDLQEGTIRNMTRTEREDAAAGGRKFTFTANSIMIPESGMQSTQNKRFTTNVTMQYIQVKTYQKAIFKDGAWHKRGETVVAADEVKPGAILIPYKTAAGAYEMDYSYESEDNTVHPFKNQDNPDGVYWRVLKAENTGLIGELVTITTGQWTSDGDEPEKLSDSYPAGTAIQVSGSQWDRNNRDETIKSVDDDTRTLYFQDDTWLYGGQPVTADKDGTINSTQDQQTVTITETPGFSIGAVNVFCREPAEKWTVNFYNDADTTPSGKPELAFKPAGAKIYGGDILYNTKAMWQDTSSVTVQVMIPDMDFICESQNRLWGVSNKQTNRVWDEEEKKWHTYTARGIYCSELGKPDKWYTFEGTDSDSWQTAEGTDGDFTGLREYGSNIIAAKADQLLVFYGSGPSSYGFNRYEVQGVQAGSHKSMQVIGQVLYYLGTGGVYAYAGTTPQLISWELGPGELENGRAGTDRRRYFLSARSRGTGETHMLIYDPVLGFWTREDGLTVKDFAFWDDTLYMAAETDVFAADQRPEILPEHQAGKAYYLGQTVKKTGEAGTAVYLAKENIPAGTALTDKRWQQVTLETVSWTAEFGAFTEGTLAKKKYQWLRLRYKLEDGASLTVKTRQESGYPGGYDQKTVTTWAKVGAGEGTVRIPVSPHRLDKTTIMLEGTGQGEIQALERQFIEGSKK